MDISDKPDIEKVKKSSYKAGYNAGLETARTLVDEALGNDVEQKEILLCGIENSKYERV